MNKRGPRMDPWGTPVVKSNISESESSISTYFIPV